MKLRKVITLVGASFLAAAFAFNTYATTQVLNGSTTTQDLKSAAPVILTYEAMDISDTEITFDGNSKLTVSETGKYQVRYAVNWEINNNRRRQIKTYLLKNGSEVITQSTAYAYARQNTQVKFATNTASITLELNAGDYLEVAAVGEAGDGASLGNGTALTRSGESVFSIESLNTETALASGAITFEKCQVMHTPTPTYPSCPVGFESVHDFSKGMIHYYDRPGVKHAFGLYPNHTEDDSWFYNPYQQYVSNAWRITATLACSICTNATAPAN